ncbi:gamma-secretase subunit pen-2 [Condylostylus longicornis]|uniref:gamma-secretase subunit pen-2 n=1 Tax=Condylostylus longicornis TaxID=2530218 RepID=UPI00244E3397|nr:gamma-secretase subunit pen-2 [Condylostylus longicornis]
MDLSKMSDERKLYLCNWYFKAGFAFLPFVWIINSIWFYSEAFLRSPFEHQKQMKKYVLLSGTLSLMWLSIAVLWVTVFQNNRDKWGQFGDAITFVIPLGVV